MASITTRAGKGSPLTNAEVDANFTDINTELGQKLIASNLTPYLTSSTAASTYQPLLGYTPLNRAAVSDDWNTKTNGQAVFISSFSNSHNGTTVTSGLYMPHATGGFGVQVGGRLDNLYFRTEEDGTWAAWRTLVHSGNFTSQALSSSQVTTALGFTPVSNIARALSGADLDTLTTSGFYRIGAANANRPGDYGQLLTVYGGGDTIGQIYVDWNNGTIISRAGNPSNVGGAGTWRAWRTSLNSGNYTSYSPSLTGSGASGTWGISITGSANSATYSQILDTRAGQLTPNEYQDYRATYEFTNQIVGSDWHTAMTLQGWHDGYAAWQIIGPSSSGAAHENWYLRSGVNTSWNALRSILHSGNYTSYSPSLTGSGASGTWGISISGNAATATTATNVSGGTVSSARINPRTSTAATTAAISPDIASFDQYAVTAQASALTINAPTGTPVDGNKLMFRLLDDGTARALTWGAAYTPIGVTLPATTVANKTTYVGCIYNSTHARWDVIAVTTQA